MTEERRVGTAHRAAAGLLFMVGIAHLTGIAAVYYGTVEVVRA